MSDDIAVQSATELLRLYRSKQLSPVEATKAALAQISTYDPQLNATKMLHSRPLVNRRRVGKRGRPKDCSMVYPLQSKT
jgi:aspartyl-tRNA(Asn)/glutamyl-tRNA(Gln) amidotransferase subunit A